MGKADLIRAIYNYHMRCKKFPDNICMSKELFEDIVRNMIRVYNYNYADESGTIITKFMGII